MAMNQYLEISPVFHQKKKVPPKKVTEPPPVLFLKEFSSSPKLSFDDVKIGTTEIKVLVLTNAKDQFQQVVCDKFPNEEKGFSISNLNVGLEAGESCQMQIQWSPFKEGNIREIISLKTSLGVRCQVILLGTAKASNPKKKKAAQRRPLVESNCFGNKMLSKPTYQPPSLSLQKENAKPAPTYDSYKSHDLYKSDIHFENVYTSTSSKVTTIRENLYQNPQKLSQYNEESTQFMKETFSISEYSTSKQTDIIYDDPFRRETFTAGIQPTFTTETKVEKWFDEKILPHTDPSTPSLRRETFIAKKSESPVLVTPEKPHGFPKTLKSSSLEFLKIIESTDSPQPTINQFSSLMSNEGCQFDSNELLLHDDFDQPTIKSVENLSLLSANDHKLDFKSEYGGTDVDTCDATQIGTALHNELYGPTDFTYTSKNTLDMSTLLDDCLASKKESGKNSIEAVTINKDLQFLSLDNSADSMGRNSVSSDAVYSQSSQGSFVTAPNTPAHFKPRGATLEQIANKTSNEWKALLSPESKDETLCVESFTDNHSVDNQSGGTVILEKSILDVNNIVNLDQITEETKQYSLDSSFGALCSTAIKTFPDNSQPLNLISRKQLFHDVSGIQPLNEDSKSAFQFLEISPKRQSARDQTKPRSAFKNRIKPSPALKVDFRTIRRKEAAKQSISLAKTLSSIKGKSNQTEMKQQQPADKEKRTAKTPKRAPEKSVKPFLRKKSNITSLASTFNSTRDIKKRTLRPKPALMLSRLALSKTASSKSIVHHPNPFAARNVYYDDRWIEKQTLGFTKWLNFVLTPSEEDSHLHKVDVAKLWTEVNRNANINKAPTRESMSLKTYTAHSKLNRLRRAACRLYQTDDMAEVIVKLENAIEKNYISIRKDKQTHADLGLKQSMLKLLLCYNPLWLRIGLETVYGTIIFLASNNDVDRLTYFLITRLINNPLISERYAHPTVPHRYKPGFEEALKDFQLKKFLLLVYFLDRAKDARLIDHDPCLFNKQAEIKNTKDILCAFAREFLGGIGDITKHLAYLGYKVTVKQTPLDEFDYAVTNLGVDLRCGVRLTRIAEILLQDFTLSKSLRVPCLSRLQKIHNTEIALKAFAHQCPQITTKYSAKDLVDGHREKTLDFLWTIVFTLQINRILSVARLKEEVKHLRNSLKVKAATDSLAQNNIQTIENGCIDMESEDDSTQITLQYLKYWAQLVCAHYDVKVDNLSVSFCDGRAFCLILHHYHPQLVSLAHINMETTQTLTLEEVDLNSSLNTSISGNTYTGTEGDISRRITNEKSNFALFLPKVHELGSVPILIRTSDMVNTIPDEKLTTTFLSYLCARLLDLSVEIKAARIIQVAIRKWLNKRKLRVLERHTGSAIIIQRWWRRNLKKIYYAKYSSAALTIQTHWRRTCAQKTLSSLRQAKILALQNEAATIIQKHWKGKSTRRKCKNLLRCIVTIQSSARAYIERRRYIEKYNRICYLQRQIRAYLITKKVQQRYNEGRELIIKVQAYARGFLARRHYGAMKRNVIIVQSCVRRYLQQKNYRSMYSKIIHIQRAYRSWSLMIQTRNHFLIQKQAITLIQKTFRRWIAFHRLRKDQAATQIQAYFRAYLQRKKYQELRRKILVIQQRYRSWSLMVQDRLHFLRQRKAAVHIQDYYRRWAMQQRVKKERAACKVQACYRRYSHRMKYKALQKSAIVIQRSYRSWCLMVKDRNQYLAKREAAIKIQSYFRAYAQRMQYRKLQKNSIIIQRAYRSWSIMVATRKQYLAQKTAAIKIQSHIRAYFHTKNYQRLQRNTVAIQRAYRSWSAMLKERNQHLLLKKATIKIQAHFRGYVQKYKYQQLQKSTLVIQRAYRSWSQMVTIRNRYLAQKKAATIIQARFRGYVHRTKYQQLKKNVMVIQRAYRCWSQMVTMRNRYLAQKKAATKIQAHFRGYVRRTKYQKLKKNVMVIQRAYRCWSQMVTMRNRYLAQKKAATIIQTHFRGFAQRTKYQQLKKNTIVIQRAYRSWSQMVTMRNRYLAQKQAATKIQAHFRGYVRRTKYRQLKKKAMVIQKAYRSWSQMVTMRNRYLAQEKAATIIQAHFRGYVRRTKYRQLKKNVMVIQRAYRCWSQMVTMRNRYLAQKKAATIIQTHFRGFAQRTKYQQLKKNTIVIQRAYRSWSQMVTMRNRYLAQKKAATFIQTHFRGFAQRTKYQQLKKNTIVIQRAYRSWSQMVTMRNRYLAQKKAATFIQTHFRGFAQRTKYQQLKKNAIVIQRAYRSWSQMVTMRNRYLSQKQAATKIQAHFRGYVRRTKYRQLKKKAMVIQKAYRSWSQMVTMRKRYLAQEKAATIIQAHFRGYVRRTKYRQLKKKAMVIQKAYRSWSQMVTMRNHLAQKQAATKIQAHFRGYVRRTKYRQLKKKAMVIQKAYRSWSQMVTMRNRYLAQKKAATIIQAHFRGYVRRTKYRQLKKKAMVIQKAYRSWSQMVTMRNHLAQKQAATKIQAHFRGYVRRTKYRQLKKKAMVIQKAYRSWSQMVTMRNRYLAQKKAATIIQAHFRGYVRRTKYRQLKKKAMVIQKAYRSWSQMVTMRNHLAQKQAATKIQAHFRGYVRRTKYRQLKKKAMVIQKAYRSWSQMVTMRNRYLAQKKAATIIQAHFRGYVQRTKYHQLQKSAVIIQRTYRSWCFITTARNQYLAQRKAAIKIQTCIRVYLQKRRSQQLCKNAVSACMNEEEAVIKIQAYFRGYIQKKFYKVLQDKAIVIQRAYRIWKLTYKVRHKFLVQRQSAIKIQAYFRSYLVRKAYVELRTKTLIIQRAYRSWALLDKNRNEFVMREETASNIQSFYRAWAYRRQTRIRAAEKIKKWWLETREKVRRDNCRNPIASNNSDNVEEKSAIIIQSWFRCIKVRKEYVRKRHASITIQRYWRNFYRTFTAREYYIYLTRAVIILQAAWRARKARIEAKRIRMEKNKGHEAATVIQAAWRGYLFRKRSVLNQRMSLMRVRLHIANKGAHQEDNVNQKCTVAVGVLLSGTVDLGLIISALTNLDRLTRISPATCELFGESGGPKAILNIMRASNRSIPFLKILEYSADVLINLAKYKKTLCCVLQVPGLIEELLRQMKIYYKTPAIFNKTATLLYILYPSITKELQISLVCPQIQSIHKMLMSKHAVAYRNKIPPKLKPLPQCSCPTMLPDWVDHNAVREFTNVFESIMTLHNIF